MPFNVGPVELLVMLAMLVVLVLVIRAATTAGTRKRVCPACGSPVQRGLTTCPTCQHDFASARQA
jgi:predicted amidophosphoribosyltransferase